MSWTIVKESVESDRERRLHIMNDREIGCFACYVERFFPPRDKDEGAPPNGIGTPANDVKAGYYSSADDAERAARQDISWL